MAGPWIFAAQGPGRSRAPWAGLGAALLALVLVMAPLGAGAVTVNPGANPALEDVTLLGTRYRGPNSGDEIFVGLDDLGSGADRNGAGYPWSLGLTDFAFSYDSNTGIILSSLTFPSVLDDPNPPPGALDFVEVMLTGPTGLSLDNLTITVSNRGRQGGEIAALNVMVNGEEAGDFAPPAPSFVDFAVSDFPVLPVLTVTGQIRLTAPIQPNEGERLRFQIVAGEAPARIPLPAPVFLLLSGLAALGVVARRRAA